MKKLIVVLLAMLSAFTLASCGGAGIVKNAGEALEVLGLDDLKANSSKEKPIEVVFWHSFGQDISEEVSRICEEFEEMMAEQEIYIEVSAESTGGGYDGLRSRINMGIKSSAIPTMALGYPDHFSDYISNGIMLSLDEYINDSEVGLSAEDRADFITTYWNENIFSINGKDSVVGIPFNKSSEVMYYNASAVDPILLDLGYITEDDPYWRKPTWEQLWTVSAEIQKRVTAGTLTWDKNGPQTADKSAKYPVIVDSAANLFITVSHQWGGDGYYTTIDENNNGVVVFNNSVNVEAQEYFLAKTKLDLFQLPDKLGQTYGSKLMINNQSFISIGSTAGVKNNGSNKYELKVAPYPQKSYDDSSYQSVIQQGTNACILSKNSNNLTRAAAWELIKYMTSSSVTAEFSMATGYLPVRQSAIESEDYVNFLSDFENPFTGYVAQAVNAAYAQKDYFYTDPAFNGSSIVRDRVDSAMISVYCQDKNLQSALDDLYKALRTLKINCEKLEE